MEHLKIDVDNDVFKLNDSKVQRLRTGKLSVEAFVMLIQPGDPYVLIGNTIYALTEQEYYALRAIKPLDVMTETAFHHVLELEDLSFMNEQDRMFLDEVKEAIPNCTACRYKRYKDEVYKLVKKYSIPLPEQPASTVNEDKGEYPGTTGDIYPNVFNMTAHMYKVEIPDRRSCIDCVEKHVAQAYVLSKEFFQGYPEYISMVIGHLGEAIDELPKDFTALKDSLEFCLARTKYTRIPFVPLYLILPMLACARKDLSQSVETQRDINVDNTLFELDITEQAEQELDTLDTVMARKFAASCMAADNFILKVENLSDFDRVSWEGSMAYAADMVAEVAPGVANIIRNRRLLFLANPVLARTSGYMLSDIVERLLKGDALSNA